jgi:HEAT repeat protein
MAQEGAIDCLIILLESTNELTQRQAAKALANLGVSNENKAKIAEAGGIPKLVSLAGISAIGVRIEAVAALANLAVNGIALLNSLHNLVTWCL